MTNKLLTLEEIEKIEKFRAEMIELEPESCELGVWQVEMSRFNQYQLQDLLATASAYWELKEQQTSELVEIGKQNLTISTMEKVAKVLGVSVDQLLK